MRKRAVQIGHVAHNLLGAIPEMLYFPGPGNQLSPTVGKIAEMTSGVLTNGGVWCACCVQIQATCSNTHGSVECTCIEGYEGNGSHP